MRYVTYLVTPKSGELGRVGRFFAEHGVPVESIRDLDVLTDGTVVMLFEIAERPDRLAEVLETGWPELYNYEIVGGDEHPLVQLNFEPTGIHAKLHDVRRSHAVLIDYPIEIVDQASQTLRVTEVGYEDELRALIEDTREVADVTIEKLGRYDPTEHGLYAQLSEAQQEILRTAIDVGYFSEPREATYEDIAAKVECSPSAVGKHLRRLQSKILPEIVPESAGLGA